MPWVRVRDPQTGHEFDRRDDDPKIASGRYQLVKSKRYPPAAYPRPAKHHIKLAGRQAASRESATSPEAPEATEPTEE